MELIYSFLLIKVIELLCKKTVTTKHTTEYTNGGAKFTDTITTIDCIYLSESRELVKLSTNEGIILDKGELSIKNKIALYEIKVRMQEIIQSIVDKEHKELIRKMLLIAQSQSIQFKVHSSDDISGEIIGLGYSLIKVLTEEIEKLSTQIKSPFPTKYTPLQLKILSQLLYKEHYIESETSFLEILEGMKIKWLGTERSLVYLFSLFKKSLPKGFYINSFISKHFTNVNGKAYNNTQLNRTQHNFKVYNVKGNGTNGKPHDWNKLMKIYKSIINKN